MWRELDIDAAVGLSDHQVVPRQPRVQLREIGSD